MSSDLALEQDAMTECFFDVEALLQSLVHAFGRRYGGCPQDLWSQALGAYVEAFKSYDRKNRRTKFSSWVYYKVWRILLDTKRTQARRHAKLKPVDYDLIEHVDPQSARNFRFEVFLADLSDDAAYLVRSVLFQPPDILLILAGERNITPKRLRSALREFLVDLKWSEDRINTAWSEVQSAL